MNVSQLAFVLLLSFVAVSGVSGAVPLEKDVIIRNDLGGGRVLGLHCVSADDDLGFRVLPPNEEWDFRFRTSFFLNTLFHCGFVWAGSQRQSFAVYDDRKYHGVCTQCLWSIQTNGTCLISSSITQVDCYPWAPAW
ncbi:hypothetical protein MLD38_018476 [Melastoma candidum]|uniref:Uncharacterized protein n=1 Tax=Melastoma candidum TaxID=119954 RepID=A0ACB9QU44_9MYRT|nr:hypothetical protein MLD38_018476 [Melastoma candidum]